MKTVLEKIADGAALSEEEMAKVMRTIMRGEANDDDVTSFLTLLAQRGETVDEIVGAARVLREQAATIHAPAGSVDCCGTGGDGLSTYNISTAVALVTAACGVPLAKHGNRSASSKSGAADVLESLGVNLDAPLNTLEGALEQLNFCFLMATQHHKAMKHVVHIRKKLGFRTIFNLLGPLANPANADYQLIGVFDRKWTRPIAESLQRLGVKRGWVVHGHDGLDEISISERSSVVMFDDKEITETELSPSEFGLDTHPLTEITGGNAEENAKALLNLLDGEKNAYRDIVLANAAAVLSIHNDNQSLPDSVQIAAEAIDQGHARTVLSSYIEFVKPEN